MPEPQTISRNGFADAAGPAWRRADPDGPGTLILVVGPSGAGKDTLLNAARRHFRKDEAVQFCERLITRTDQTGEKHAAISEAEFARLSASGGFFLSWAAHGLHYGVGADALYALRAGKTVIVNVSRQIIGEARERWPNTHVVYVTASEEARRQRLMARGRESAANIDSRLQRGRARGCPEAEWVSLLDNSGALAEGTARFNALLTRIIRQSADSAAAV